MTQAFFGFDFRLFHFNYRRQPLRGKAWPIVWICATSLSFARVQEPIDFSVDQGPADKTLYAFASQASLLCAIDPGKFEGVITHRVVGPFTIEEALKAFTQGTDIVYLLSPDRTSVSFDRRSPSETTVSRNHDSPSNEGGSETRPAQPPQEVARVTVTGSRLRTEGGPPIGGHLLTFSGDDIRESGADSLASFLNLLPQTFGGGATPDTRLGVDALANTGIGVSANLRGLGPRAVLVLINGQRLAPSGDNSSFVDLSNIPLGAVDRVEILLDGASAVYGSDAIAGVVNVITKGAKARPETFLQWDSVTRGSEHSGTFYQTLKRQWEDGTVIVSFGGSYQSALPADERSFYTADLSYGHGPNLQPAAAPTPTLSSLDGRKNWALVTANVPYPTALDFKANAKNYLNPYEGYQIIASQEPLGAYFRLDEAVKDGLRVSVDAFINRRRASQNDGPQVVSTVLPPGSPYYVQLDETNSPLLLQTSLMNLLGPKVTVAEVTVTNISAEANADIADNVRLDIAIHHASERESQLTRNSADLTAFDSAIQHPSSTLNFNPYDQTLDKNTSTLTAIRSLLRYDSLSQVENVTLSLDFPIGSIPMGQVWGAAGAELRDQRFRTYVSQNGVAPYSARDYERHIFAEFAEIRLPIANPDMKLPWAHRIDLDIAVRREDYSDFGGATTPRVGLAWEITDGITLRSVYAKSFRAPAPGDLDQSTNTVAPRLMTDPQSPTGESSALIETGNNSGVKQERGVEKSFGIESHFRGLRFSLDYFAIRDSGRIQATQYSDQLLSNAGYNSIVKRNPTPAEVRSACTSGQFLAQAGTCLGWPTQAIIDLRLENVDAVETRGLDFDTSLQWRYLGHKFEWRINGTYLLEYSETAYPGASSMNLLNTEHYPINLRFKNSLSWEYGASKFSMSMNYTGHYRDTDVAPNQPISSLTTFDASLSYSIGERGKPGAIEILGGVRNITDRQPPFLINLAEAVGYDEENADPCLRTWTLSILKRW